MYVDGVSLTSTSTEVLRNLPTVPLCLANSNNTLDASRANDFTFDEFYIIPAAIKEAELAKFIVGAFPDAGTDPRAAVSDYITQGGRTGLKVDPVNSLPFAHAHGGGIGDFSAGRPADSVGGEWGVMSETGLGLFADPFQVYLRANVIYLRLTIQAKSNR